MTKKLYRSRKDKMLGGVAGGLAEYFEIDPTIVRVIFVVTLFLGGSGIIAYIILWIVVPEEPLLFNQSGETPTEQPETDVNYQMHVKTLEEKRKRRTSFFATVLIIIGIFLLADNYFPHFYFKDFFPVILIAIGIGLLISSNKK